MVRLMEEREAGRVFGEVAETYDRVRQPYPEELFGDVLDYAGDARTALEVGAGTGRATAGFATRGLTVTAIEPDAEMAAILARRASGVRIEHCTFEQFRPAERFGLVYSAEAWHWTKPGGGWWRD
jgi:trans-aconitate methyltransferase